MSERKVRANFWIERGDVEIDLVAIGFYSPACEGRLSGPPEDCFPPTPSAGEIDRIELPTGELWEGTLTEEENTRAIDALIDCGEGL